MHVTLLGAAGGEVTGSAYLLRTDRANVMIDELLWWTAALKSAREASADGGSRSPAAVRVTA